MRTRFAGLAAVLFLSGPLAGCLGDDGGDDVGATSLDPSLDVAAAPAADLPPPVRVFDDPQGDAKVWTSDMAEFAARGPCARNPIRDACNAAVLPVFDSTDPVGAVPAPAEYDILDATFAETPASLIVELGVASVVLDPSQGGSPVAEGPGYVVCWSTRGSECTEQATLNFHGPGPLVDSRFRLLDRTCHPLAYCVWTVPVEVIEGSPGLIRWTIPRAIMPNATVGDTLQDPEGAVFHHVRHADDPALFASVGAPVGQAAAPSTRFPDSADRTDPSTTALTFVLAPAAPVVGAPMPLHLDNNVEPFNEAEGHSADLLGVHVTETPETLSIATKVAVVPDPLTGHRFGITFRLWNGTTIASGYSIVDGAPVPFGGKCGDACPQITPIPIAYDIIPGEPGWINATMARRDLDSPGRGALVALLETNMHVWQSVVDQGEASGTRALVQRRVVYDFTGAAAPYWLMMDTASADLEAQSVFIADDAGDVDDPTSALPGVGGVAQFDITFIEARGLSDHESLITLGIADLKRTSPPAGYEAAMYAVGIEAAGGAVMVAYHKNSKDEQKFLCAPDTAVFGATRTDPLAGLYEEIPGAISLGDVGGDPDADAVATTGAAITFTVPHDRCFGTAPARLVHAERLAAGTYLIQDLGPGGRSVSAPRDVASSDGPVDWAAPVMLAPVTVTPWYQSPFDVANFWDIAGVVAGVVFFLLGLLVVRRRRRVLKRYLVLVEAAAAISDAKQREAGLRGLRARLKDDIVRGRISDGHYAVVERRLDEHLAKARVEAVAEAFGDLPHRVLLKLQELLADGSMAEDDFRVVTTMLEQTQLKDAAKAGIRKALRLWVAEDREQRPASP